MLRSLTLVTVLLLGAGGTLAAQDPLGPLAAQPAEEGLLNVRANLNVRDVAIGAALHQLSRTSGVPLAFSSSLVPGGAVTSCACVDLTVRQALDEILRGTSLGYSEVRRQVVIEPLAHPYATPHRAVALASRSVYLLPSMEEVRPIAPAAEPGTAPSAELRTGTITGRVLNAATSEPLPAAQVVVVGTQHGTISGPDGRFRITSVPAGTWELRATLVGYRPVTQAVTLGSGATATVELRLTHQAVELDAVVVTGTAGAATRRELGNSVGTVTSRQLELLAGSSISEALQGQTAGLQFFANDGQVGTGNTIVLRGINSVTQGSEPLIYIDGVRVNNPAFAANTFTGVAAAGNPGAEGAQTSPKPMDALNPADIERVEVIRGAAATTLYGTEAAGGVIQIFTKRGAPTGQATWTVEGTLGSRFQTANSLGPVVGNDPGYLGLERFLRTGGVRGAGLSVQGGSDYLRYFLSGSHDHEEGVVPNNHSGRSTVRGNFGFRPHPDLFVDLNTSFATRSSEFAETGDNTYGLLLNVFRGELDNTGGRQEILFDIENRSTDDRFVGGVTLVHTPTSSLVNRFTAGIDYTNAFNRQTIPFGFQILPQGRREINRWTNRILSMDYAGTWSTQLTESVSSAFSWGGQVFQNFDHAQFATAEGFGGPGDKTIRSGAVTRSDETQLTVVNAGAFVQEVLGFRNRLFLTGGFRIDGNSAFGEALGLQVYPKLSGSWVVSEEPFWPAALGLMRLRAAVGESGKAPGAFDAVRTWSPVPGYGGRPGVSPSTVGNPELGPERSREVELGFETAVLGDRVSGEFTWFRAVTSDALFAVPAPPSMGFLSSPLRNVGKIENRGVETSLTVVPVTTRTVHWELGGKYSTANSKVLDMGGSAPFNVGFAFLGQWIREGYPVVAAFGAKVTNPDEIADPIIEQDAYLGPIYPTRHYSLSSTLRLGGRVTFYALGQGSGGNVAANNMARQGVNRGRWPECYDRTDLENQPAIWRARCVTNSDLAVWTRPADFFRLRTVSVSLQLPERMVPAGTTTTLLVSAQNLWRSQGYTGLDPELTRGGRFSVAPARYEYYQLPPPQGVTVTVRSTF